MFPYTTIKPAEGKAFAFQHVSTGEILEFGDSWASDPERMFEILMQNHMGDYEVILP